MATSAAKPRIELWYELETRCNLHCGFCFNFWKDGTASPPERMDTQNTLAGLDLLLGSVNCQKVTVSGGEPLLREDLISILNHVAVRGIPAVLTTNGTLLTERGITSLLESGVKAFQIPLHSARRDVHDSLSGASCFRASLGAIIRLKQAGAQVAAVFVATRTNLDDFPNVVTLCAEFDVKDVIFNRFVPSGASVRNRELLGCPDEESLLAIVVHANDRARRLGVTVHLGVPIRIPDGVLARLDHVNLASCPVARGQTRWTLDAQGNLRRCNHSGTVFANVFAGGVEALVAEINSHVEPSTRATPFRCCQILEGAGGLVQLGHLPTAV